MSRIGWVVSCETAEYIRQQNVIELVSRLGGPAGTPVLWCRTKRKTQKLDGSQTVFSGSAGNYLVGRVFLNSFGILLNFFMKCDFRFFGTLASQVLKLEFR